MLVYLIGAGPGDPGLLTLKAKAVLETADVVVYDYLANQSFLTFCRKDAEIIYVGKKGGDHTLPQDQINQLLVTKAKEGKVIARLKGGDPYVFGRGAEEAQELLAAGVKFEVVPGVTSGVAGLAYAGIPVTHRSYASSVSFITGHEDPTKAATALHWDALAKSASTLVFFMGMKNLPDIAANLMGAGMPGSTPAALVHWGATCRHRSCVGTLETLPRLAKEQRFTSPSLIVVGEVCKLHDELNFFEQRPLLGKGIVVTRAREQASDLASLLEAQGACVHQFPTIAVTPLTVFVELDKALDALDSYDWLVFTSINGVEHFWNRLLATGRDSRALAGCKVAAIGPATAQGLKDRGIVADFIPERFVAEYVAEGMLASGAAGKKILVPRAKEARELLPDELRKAGCHVDVVPVYETVRADSDAAALLEVLQAGGVHCVTFASSSTVDNFFSLVPADEFRRLAPEARLACIGPVTANTLKKYGFNVDIQPEDYTIPGLVQAVVDHFTP